MKAYKIIIVFLLTVFLSFTLYSCRTASDPIKEQFEKYPRDDNVVGVLDNTSFYFADHELQLLDLIDEEEPNHGYLFKDGRLYFSVSKENGLTDFSLIIYSCDLYGNDKQLVFEKQGYKTHPWATGNQGIFYIEHYSENAFDESSRVIDSYNILTGAYEKIASGEQVSLSDYYRNTKESYSCSAVENVITLSDSKTNATYSIDLQSSQADQFNDSLADIEYNFEGFTATEDNRILLLYRLKTKGSSYPFIICEYLPDTDKVVFCSVFFAYDYTPFNIECID